MNMKVSRPGTSFVSVGTKPSSLLIPEKALRRGSALNKLKAGSEKVQGPMGQVVFFTQKLLPPIWGAEIWVREK